MNTPIYSKPIVILAGGSAVRFNGKDKGQILIGGKRMIDIILQNIQYKTNPLIISGPHDYGLKALVILDDLSGPLGPVGGIYSTWKYFKDKSSSCVKGFYTLAIDVPNPPANFLEKIYSETTSNIAVVGQQQHPAHGWWRMEDLERVFSNISKNETISLHRLALLNNSKAVTWMEGDTFSNINSEKELKNYSRSYLDKGT